MGLDARDAADAAIFPAVWTIHCDGSALPNPGRIGLGAVIVAPDGQRHELSQTTPHIGCNNEAELRALMAALAAARNLGAHATALVRVFSDSRVVVDRLAAHAQGLDGLAHGATPVASARPVTRLEPVFAAACASMADFGAVDLRWIPQRRNGDADALARAALGLVEPRATDSAARRRRKRNR